MFLTTPLADLPRLDLGQQLLLHGDALVLDQLCGGMTNDVAAGLVDLEDLALDGLVDVVGDGPGGRRISTWLAGKKRRLTPMLTKRPPLILRVTVPLTNVAFPCGLAMTSLPTPSSARFGLTVAQDDGAPNSSLDGRRASTWMVSPGLGRARPLSMPSSYHSLRGDNAFALVAERPPRPRRRPRLSTRPLTILLTSKDLVIPAASQSAALAAPRRRSGLKAAR